jgi:hypothetical protein
MTEHPDMSPVTEACTPVARPPRLNFAKARRLRANSGPFKNWLNITAMGRKAAQNN